MTYSPTLAAALNQAGWHDPSADNRPSARQLIAQRASDITPEPVEWLWPGRIALGKQTLFAGEAGLGKSQLTISVAAAVSTGGEWPCGEARAPLGSVIILSAEDGAADTIVPRLMAAGADRSRVHLVSAVRNDDGNGRRAFNLQGDLDLLESKIADLEDGRLVIIDPISSYLGPKVDSHVNAAVRGILEPIGEMAARLRVAVLSVTHPPKGTGTTAINRFIGSIGFIAAARAAFMVTRDADDETRRLFLPVKNNLAPLGKGLAFRLEQRIIGDDGKGIVASSVVWEDQPVAITADEALAATDTAGDDRGREADDFLRDVLAKGEAAAAEIKREAQGAGLAWATVRRAQKRLGIRPVRRADSGGDGLGGRGHWYWSLPDDGPALLRCSSPPYDAHPFKVSTLGENEHLRRADQRNGSPVEAMDDPRDCGPMPEILIRRPPALGPPGDSLDDLK
jgi:putative DNA primase/helicase